MLLLRKQEFNEAIVHIHTRSATGQGDIPPTFLKALGPRAGQKLLETQILFLEIAPDLEGRHHLAPQKMKNHQDAYIHSDQLV